MESQRYRAFHEALTSHQTSAGSIGGVVNRSYRPGGSSVGFTKRIKNWTSRPAFLGILGVILICSGIALIVLGSILPPSENGIVTRDPVTTNSEGIPENNVMPANVVQKDCNSNLQDREGYETRAFAAEKDLYGVEVRNLSISDATSIFKGMATLSVSVSFWMLHSNDPNEMPHDGNDMSTINDQMLTLNAAFFRANIVFQLRSVHNLSVSKEEYDDCTNSESVKKVRQYTNSTQAVLVFVCNPKDVIGSTGIFGDSVERQDDAFQVTTRDSNWMGAIYIRLVALKFSKTSLVHQFGHFFGIPHPYPSYRTCLIDGDFIMDTPRVYQPSNSCVAEDSPLCYPEAKNLTEIWGLPGEYYMNISPDSCRNKFTPGQILRMRALMAKFLNQGYGFLAEYSRAQKDIEKMAVAVSYPIRFAFQSELPSSDLLGTQIQNQFVGTDLQQMDAKDLELKIYPFTDAFRYALLGTDELFRDERYFTCVPITAQTNSTWTGKLQSRLAIDGVQISIPIDTLSQKMDDSKVSDVQVLVFIGDTLYLGANTPCTKDFVPITSLTERIICDSSINGSVITLMIKSLNSDPFCFSNIVPLSLAFPVMMTPTLVLDLDELYIPKSDWLFVKSTGMGDSAARKAIYTDGAGIVNIESSCSSSGLAKQPSWSFDLRDSVLLESATLGIPLDCNAMIDYNQAIGKSDISNFISSVVGDCYEKSKSAILNISLSTSRDEFDASKSSIVAVRPGSYKQAYLNELAYGDTFLVSRQPTIGDQSLSLCNIQFQGSGMASLGNLVSLSVFNVLPRNLISKFAFAVDGDLSTCITPKLPDSNVSTSWEAMLKTPKVIRAVLIKGNGPFVVEVLDAEKVPIWSSFARNSSIYQVPRVFGSWLKISGFTTLCEVLINEDDTADRVLPFSSEKREEMAIATYATKRTKGSWLLAPGVEEADANARTCRTYETENQKKVTIPFSRNISAKAVAILADSFLEDTSVWTLPSDSNSNPIFCHNSTIFPWKFEKFQCSDTPVEITGIEVQVNAGSISICELLLM